MATSPNAVDFDLLYKNFKDLVFEKYGKKLSDKDPLVLQFMMQELFTRELSKRLSEFVTLSNGKLMTLADLWEKRENESFEKLSKKVDEVNSNISSKINNELQDALNNTVGKTFQNWAEKFAQVLENKSNNLKSLNKLTYYLVGISSFLIGCSLVLLLGKILHVSF